MSGFAFGSEGTYDVFDTLESIGSDTESSESAFAITQDTNSSFYVVGKSEPYSRSGASDLPEAEIPGLKQKDAFIARISSLNRSLNWVMRTGTSQDDWATGIAIDPTGDFIYVVGETNGQFGTSRRHGQSDAFVLKYDVRPTNKPVRAWSQPLIIGSNASESASAVAVGKDGKDVFVVGYTTGSLFTTSSGNADGFICRISAVDGVLLAARQFGTAGNDYAQRISFLDNADSPILVGVETQRIVGAYEISNMNVFKFRSSDLSPLGSVLVKTFSRESLTGLVQHPLFPNQIFLAGSSWLEQQNGWEISVKRLNQAFDDISDIGKLSVDLDSLKAPQYAVKYGSKNGGDEKITNMAVFSKTGRLIVSGVTTGSMLQNVSAKGSSQVFLAVLGPDKGDLGFLAQEHLSISKSYSLIAGFVESSNDTIVYATTRVNETSGALYVTVNSYQIPLAWQTTVVPTMTAPSPSEGPTAGISAEVSKHAMPREAMFAIIACGCILCISIVALIAYQRLCKRSNLAKLGPRNAARQLPVDP